MILNNTNYGYAKASNIGFLIFLKRESAIQPNEEIIRHNICNVELQANICDV